jgi:2',3'-cyclic-nucleotide 2'-phosphodiesterase (5'-nucleotidase family)
MTSIPIGPSPRLAALAVLAAVTAGACGGSPASSTAPLAVAGVAAGARVPAISWSPATAGAYAFGTVDAGGRATATFTLTNSGGSATAELDVDLSGSPAFALVADRCSDRSLGPRRACTVTVAFSPARWGERDAATLTAQGEKAAAAASLALSGESPRRLAVLSTTDEHSHQLAFGPELDDWPIAAAPGAGALKGGAARRATVLAVERATAAAAGIETLTVSSGDFSQGTLAQVPFTVTNPDLVMLARLGYDAVAIGNHEFDLGVTPLAGALVAALGRAAAAGLPMPTLLLSNATFSSGPGDDALQALFGERGSGKPVVRSAVHTTASGLRIGLVSQLGPAAANVAPLAAPIQFAGGAPYASKAAAIAAIAAQLQPEIDALRGAEHVDAVILLGHGGIGATPAARGDDELLAAALRGLDLVVSGHTHLRPDALRWATDPDGRQVPVMQPAPFGIEVGRAELVFRDGHASLDTDATRTRFLQVDDTTLASPDPGIRGELAGIIAALEMHTGSGSFLEKTLTIVNGGVPVADDPTVLGDLYFKVLGHTTFDVPALRTAIPGVQSAETDTLNLDTDAMWSVANAVTPTDVAIQANGTVRAGIDRGRTGGLAFADLYRVVPLGGDPVEGSPGYPLIRFHVTPAELWGAFEFSLLASLQDSDFYLSPAGLEIVFDRSGTPYDPVTHTGGWITRMTLVSPAGARTPIFDKSLNPGVGWLVNPLGSLLSVVTPLYVAAFAQQAGITPKDATGTPLANVMLGVLLGPGGFHWKEHQALALYVREVCAANGGELPSIYDEATVEGAVPRRITCAGPVCP